MLVVVVLPVCAFCVCSNVSFCFSRVCVFFVVSCLCVQYFNALIVVRKSIYFHECYLVMIFLCV